MLLRGVRDVALFHYSTLAGSCFSCILYFQMILISQYSVRRVNIQTFLKCSRFTGIATSSKTDNMIMRFFCVCLDKQNIYLLLKSWQNTRSGKYTNQTALP